MRAAASGKGYRFAAALGGCDRRVRLTEGRGTSGEGDAGSDEQGVVER